MMDTVNEQAHAAEGSHGQHEGHEPHPRCHTVDIYVDNKKVVLHPGRYDVTTLKKLAGVPQADDLDQLVACKLEPIRDDATVHIRGCEIFIAHVKDGGSS
jgi:hypothetical protein